MRQDRLGKKQPQTEGKVFAQSQEVLLLGSAPLKALALGFFHYLGFSGRPRPCAAHCALVFIKDRDRPEPARDRCGCQVGAGLTCVFYQRRLESLMRWPFMLQRECTAVCLALSQLGDRPSGPWQCASGD